MSEKKKLCSSEYNEVLIVDVDRKYLSDIEISNVQKTTARKISSNVELKSNVNYDDLCGPWAFSIYERYDDLSCFISTFVTQTDIIFLKKHQLNKIIVSSVFGKQIYVQERILVKRKTNK